MARKSRKNTPIAVAEPTDNLTTKAVLSLDKQAKPYQVGIYARLSFESEANKEKIGVDMQKDLFLDAKQEQLTKLSKLDEFDEEVIRYLIDYVLVYDNEHIEIRWNFDDLSCYPLPEACLFQNRNNQQKH